MQIAMPNSFAKSEKAETNAQGNGFRLPLRLRTVVQPVAVAPHLRKQRDIHALCLCFTADSKTLLQIFLKGVSRRNLQQR